jgi:hypothetical protein
VSFFEQFAKALDFAMELKQEYGAIQLLRKMTINQLDMVSAKSNKMRDDPEFNMIYFKKQFAEELHNENIENLSHEDKIENLKRVYSLAKSKKLDGDFLYKLLFEILSLGPRCGQYDMELFKEFISVSDRT